MARREWRAMPILTLDLDAPRQPGEFDVSTSARARVEVRQNGRVVGVLETHIDGGKWPAHFVEDALVKFSDDVTPRDVVSDAQLPMISVVVPTICVEPDQLVRTVNTLLALDYPRFEVIIVDNRTGGPRELPTFANDERISSLREPQPGISAARNRGVAAAIGDVVAFTDDDVSVERSWLRAIGTTFALHPEVEGVGGLVLPRELETEPQQWFEEFYGGFSRSFRPSLMSLSLSGHKDPMFPYTPGRFGAGCNMAFLRSTLKRLGGFDVALGTGTPAKGGEDLAMFLNLVLAGGTVAFEPAALVRHSHRSSESSFMKQVFGYGVGLTAMYSALVVREPRRAVEIIERVPRALKILSTPRTERSASSAPSYPRHCYARQLLGMTYGPIAYLRSVIATRRFR